MHGVGFGFGQYKNLMACVAIALELVYDPDRNTVRILRVSCAADCGQLGYGSQGIASIDWASYPIMRFSGVPERIEVALLDQPGMSFLGVAEAAQGPMAAALANALAQATGVRRHDLPLLRKT